ncbi:uncharacterized protein LOC110030973 [Phalaenopsis equestris]|uniref:uncharacterized protein LOC110030973 n=1 Tax=Phalaenopsis equestris TaxID=78828 RepID=UPI0009E4E67B|nr:uncharacterized protein LOC110030973 [Phalaenopsis equestris]
MATKTPIFPVATPQHYSDYGFDPQLHYFQALEESRRHGTKRSEGSRSCAESLHFKLQKPISKEERSKTKKRRQWWKNAFGIFWKRGRSAVRVPSGPLYVTESAACRTNSGPLRAAEFMGIEVPYFSIRDLDVMAGDGIFAGEYGVRPIYLVT